MVDHQGHAPGKREPPKKPSPGQSPGKPGKPGKTEKSEKREKPEQAKKTAPGKPAHQH